MPYYVLHLRRSIWDSGSSFKLRYTPWSLVDVCQRLSGTWDFSYFSCLKVIYPLFVFDPEEWCSLFSEKIINYCPTTRRYIQEDSNFHCHCREHFKFHKHLPYFMVFFILSAASTPTESCTSLNIFVWMISRLCQCCVFASLPSLTGGVWRMCFWELVSVECFASTWDPSRRQSCPRRVVAVFPWVILLTLALPPADATIISTWKRIFLVLKQVRSQGNKKNVVF
jgi:hypothetical protein